MRPASNPATAVLIAAHNAEATLDRAVRSALAQPETAEVCIVDDASRDGTGALAQTWAARDPRVKLIMFTLNSGPAAARNAAIAATTSPWLTILDADDYMLDGRLAAMLAEADDTDFVADELIRVLDGQTPAPVTRTISPQRLSLTEFILGNMGGARGPLDLGYVKPLFRRDFLAKHGLTYRAEMRLGEDYELYARALALGARFLIMGPAGYISVEREGSLSKAHSEADLERLRDCDDGLRAIPNIAAEARHALDQHWTHVDCRLQWRRLITAVKTRNVGAALSAFHTPASAFYLAQRLGEQAWLRSFGNRATA